MRADGLQLGCIADMAVCRCTQVTTRYQRRSKAKIGLAPTADQCDSSCCLSLYAATADLVASRQDRLSLLAHLSW